MLRKDWGSAYSWIYQFWGGRQGSSGEAECWGDAGVSTKWAECLCKGCSLRMWLLLQNLMWLGALKAEKSESYPGNQHPGPVCLDFHSVRLGQSWLCLGHTGPLSMCSCPVQGNPFQWPFRHHVHFLHPGTRWKSSLGRRLSPMKGHWLPGASWWQVAFDFSSKELLSENHFFLLMLTAVWSSTRALPRTLS